MAPQLAPVESHRNHWYAYLSDFPCHVPVLAVRVSDTCATPLTIGGVRFAGASCPGEERPPEAPPVASISVSAATVAATVMWRLITFFTSGDTDRLVTLN